jgi:hypothetical protein
LCNSRFAFSSTASDRPDNAADELPAKFADDVPSNSLFTAASCNKLNVDARRMSMFHCASELVAIALQN